MQPKLVEKSALVGEYCHCHSQVFYKCLVKLFDKE